MPFPQLYDDFHERLTATVTVDENGCWNGFAGDQCRVGYFRLNVRIPGLGYASVKVTAHVALWCWRKWECCSVDDLWLAYREFREAGLELDHTCENPACRNPDHLEPCPHVENLQASRDRRAARMESKPLPIVEDDDVPF